MARTPRKWTGARSPGGLKRVRSSERRHEVLGPRRAAAKTLVRSAIDVATNPGSADPQVSLAEAMSALDRAAKTGAIHANAAARRKSRLALKVNELLAGTTAIAHGKAKGAGKSVGKAQAQKAAKARIAAGKADKAKGAQTAAGKARAALSKTTRAEAAAAETAAKPAMKAAATPVAKAAAKKAPAAKATAKPAAKKAPAKK